jgi:hypothetical protein
MRTTEVGWVTGEESPNRTASRAAVHATDLGILGDDGDGGVLAAFGDSYGAGWSAPGAGPRHADWRCNMLARTPRGEPRDGLVLREWVQDAPGHAAQVLTEGEVEDGEGREDGQPDHQRQLVLGRRAGHGGAGAQAGVGGGHGDSLTAGCGCVFVGGQDV